MKQLLIVSLLALSCVAGAGAPSSGKGTDVQTLHMQRVSGLERTLRDAVNRRDSAALDKLLSPLFEIRRAGGVIVQRSAWLNEGRHDEGDLHGLSAYEVGTSVIANFTLIEKGRPDRFVVDVWVMDQDDWRLRVRFETELNSIR